MPRFHVQSTFSGSYLLMMTVPKIAMRSLCLSS